MGMFDDMLKSDESLFKNEVALDFSFQPKAIPFREAEQKQIANSIRPLFMQRTGKNIFVYGRPGVGKTAACKNLLSEIEEQTDEILNIYLNCWHKNTTYKILLDICEVLDYKFTQNRKTDELFNIVKQLLNRKSVVFIFDEADKLEDFDFLYMIAEGIFRKSVILIANNKDFMAELDDRVISRLMAESLQFRPYNSEETREILRSRMEYAFWPGVWSKDAFEFVAKKTSEAMDIRKGLYLMREAGYVAENRSSKKISVEHVSEAFGKSTDFFQKEEELTEEEKKIAGAISENSGKKIGELYRIYQDKGGSLAYKSFQRKIEKLQKGGFITTKKTEGGREGNTTIINSNKLKKLSDFT